MFVSPCGPPQDGGVRNSAHELFDQHVVDLRDSKVPEILQLARQQMDTLFNECLHPRVIEGCTQAVEAAPGRACKWGAKVSCSHL